MPWKCVPQFFGHSHQTLVSKVAVVLPSTTSVGVYCYIDVCEGVVKMLFVFVADAGSQPEELNKKAVTIINRVRDKLTGICTVNFYFN